MELLFSKTQLNKLFCSRFFSRLVCVCLQTQYLFGSEEAQTTDVWHFRWYFADKHT